MLCNVVPGAKEEQVLRLWPEVLRKIRSDDGVRAAATHLVRLAQLGVATGNYSALCKWGRLLLNTGHASRLLLQMTCSCVRRDPAHLWTSCGRRSAALGCRRQAAGSGGPRWLS